MIFLFDYDTVNNGFAEQYKDYGGEMLVLGVVNDSEPTENGVV